MLIENESLNVYIFSLIIFEANLLLFNYHLARCQQGVTRSNMSGSQTLGRRDKQNRVTWNMEKDVQKEQGIGLGRCISSYEQNYLS